MADTSCAGLRPRLREARDDEALLALFNEDNFQRFATHLKPFGGLEEMRCWLACLGAEKFEIVCDSGGEMAGFAGLYLLADRQSHIGWFFLGVREKFQRRGVGASLMASLLGAADILAGLRRLQLTVFADNEPAIRLYRKFGFQIEGRHADFLRREDGSVDAFTMARLTTSEEAANNRTLALSLLKQRSA
jgi:putative acetyltransferase